MLWLTFGSDPAACDIASDAFPSKVQFRLGGHSVRGRLVFRNVSSEGTTVNDCRRTNELELTDRSIIRAGTLLIEVISTYPSPAFLEYGAPSRDRF
jgi:hypothetical protein